MALFSLEGLRKFNNPDFDVKELFLLHHHQRPKVVARCKVQAHEADYVVILAIAGEYVRTTRCSTDGEVWSIAVAWKTELLAHGWHPVHPTSSTVWRSVHDGWTVVVVSACGSYDGTISGYYSGYAHNSGVALRDRQVDCGGRRFAEPTVALAQMEIMRQLVAETSHVCSDRCSIGVIAVGRTTSVALPKARAGLHSTW